nr:BatA domain-containing protein [Alphaproteobacteria bacterium]
MTSLGALSFFTPWAFAGFAVLPLVWWIVRLTPPRPRRVRFPAIRLLAQVTTGQQTSQSYPWWLLVLRLVMVALLITGAATPVFNPGSSVQASGPLVVVVDDGWASATHWQSRVDYLEDLVTQADRQGRGIVLLTTALPTAPVTPSMQSPAEARDSIQALRPKPWQTDRLQIERALSDPALALSKAGRIVWLSDGLASDNNDTEFSAILDRLSRLGPVTVVQPEPGRGVNALFPPYSDGDQLVIPVRRARPGNAAAMSVVAYDAAKRAIGRAVATFETGAVSAEARLDVPVETRNRIERLQIEGERSAGAVVLLDERWRRRPVGLVSANGIGDDQPLLSGQYYLDRALQAVTEVRSGSIDELLNRETAVMTLTDPAPLSPAEHDDLVQWINDGGVLIVFAGPRIANLGSGGDLSPDGSEARLAALLPVALRSGDRAIGGAMSWRRPAAIAAFEPGSPFQGLMVPNDVRISRQVLAEPTLDLDEKTWARLVDGTPLVTAQLRGEGMVVLFHVTANAEW